MLYKRTITQRLLAILLAITMMIGLIPQSAFAMSSGGVTNPKTTADKMTAVADADSLYTYRDIFDDVTGPDNDPIYSTLHTGRIWADKSVNNGDTTFTGDLTLYNPDSSHDSVVWTKGTGAEKNTATVKMAEGAQFQTTFSTMATTSNVVNQTSAPMDLVLVIDLSPMSNSVEGKLQNSLNALNEAVNTALKDTNNRVAIVGYSSQAETLLPLGHYSSVELKYTKITPSENTKQVGQVICEYKKAENTSSNESVSEQSSDPFPIATTQGSGINKYTQYGIYKGMQVLTGAENGETSADGEETTAQQVDQENPTDVDLSERQPVMILLSEGDPKIASTQITTPTRSLIDADGWTEFSNTVAYSGEKWPLDRSDSEGETDVYKKGGVQILRNYGLSDDNRNGAINANNRHAQTFATLLTAAYAKEEVTKAYYGSNNEHNNAMRFYTVGINMNSANSPELGAMALNPRAQLNGNTTLGKQFVDYATTFFNEGSVSIKDAGANDHTTKFSLKDSGLENTGVKNIEALRYNDMYFSVTGSGANINFGDVFDQIFTNIRTDGAQGATYVTGDSAESGYITYTDPLGKYMEVKNVDALILNNKIYTDVDIENLDDNTTTYTFRNTGSGGQAEGALDNPVYGNSHGIDNIQITVTTEDNAQTVEVKVPAALIPLRLTKVDLTKENQEEIFDSNDAFPMRLVYSVGLQKDLLENGKLSAGSDLEKDTAYLKGTGEYDESTGTVTFYEGQYSNDDIVSGTDNTAIEGKTYGDAYVEYVPAGNNPFYYLTQDTPVYTNEECTKKLEGINNIQPDTKYYFQVPYYSNEDKNPTEQKYDDPIPRSGDLLKNDYIKQGSDGVYLVPGTPRMTTLTQYTTLKGANTADSEVTNSDANASETAAIRMYPTTKKSNPDDHSQPGNITFHLYLGNNGKLTVPVAEGFNVPESAVLDGEKDLTITKEVTGGKWPENESFKFTITGQNGAPMPDSTTINIEKPTDGNTATGHFGDITFDQAGTYTYTIEEVEGENDAVTYDSRTLTVTVEVGTNDNNDLEVKNVTFDDQDGNNSTDPKTFYNTIQQQSNEIPGEPGDQPPTDPETPSTNPGTPGGTTPEQPGDEPGDTPSEPEQPLDPDGPDDLNTVDHFYYIVGYPEDYRTGAVTDDESLWPIKPQGKITRAEVATIFYRLLKKDVREANTTTQNNFSDVSADDWYGTTVSTLAHMGIIAGYEDGSFRPNAPITRAEFAAIAARFFENTDVDYPAGLFSDIAGDEWYADIVAAAAELGLIGGYPDGTMRPLATISRAEACAIVNRTIERHPDEDHLADSADMRTWPDNLPGAWYYADMQEATNGHEYTWLNDEHTSEAWTEVIPDFDWSKR